MIIFNKILFDYFRINENEEDNNDDNYYYGGNGYSYQIGSVIVTEVNGEVVTIDIGDEQYNPNLIVSVSEGNNYLIGPNADLQTNPVDITFFDEFGNSVQPTTDIKICFESPDNNNDICLGSFNEETQEWECDDHCLDEENGSLCGNADHLTNFALLLSGGSGGSNACGSPVNDYILGSAWKDLVLIGSLAGFCCCFIICFILIGILFPPCRAIIYGQEGYRVKGIVNKSKTKYVITEH